jgi:hypothetical protein
MTTAASKSTVQQVSKHRSNLGTPRSSRSVIQFATCVSALQLRVSNNLHSPTRFGIIFMQPQDLLPQ